MKTYVYFVSYSHVSNDVPCFGRCETRVSRKVTTIEDVNELERLIASHNGLEQVIVLRFEMLRALKPLGFWARVFCKHPRGFEFVENIGGGKWVHLNMGGNALGRCPLCKAEKPYFQ